MPGPAGDANNSSYRPARASVGRVPRVVHAALAYLLLTACAGLQETDRAAPSIETMQGAAVDFLVARDAGDALAMARAATARRPFDVLAQESGGMTSAAMFEAARVVAAGNPALQERIRTLEAGASASGWSAGTRGLLADTNRLRSLFARHAVHPAVVRDAGPLAGERADGFPGSREPCTPHDVAGPPSRALLVPAGSSLALCASVRPDRTLIVYVEAPGGAGVALSLLDPATASVFRTSSHANGQLICTWRPGTAGQVLILLRNPGQTPAPVTLIAQQR
jgi:hypothetical protein